MKKKFKILVYIETCLDIFHGNRDVLNRIVAVNKDGKEYFDFKINSSDYSASLERADEFLDTFVDERQCEVIVISTSAGAVCIDEEEWENYKWMFQDLCDLNGCEIVNFEELYNKTTSKIPLALSYQEFLDKNLPKRMENPLALIKLYDAYKQLLKKKEV